MFDDDNLVSCAGLVSVMTLAERAGMSDLLAQMVQIDTTSAAGRSVLHVFGVLAEFERQATKISASMRRQSLK